MVDVAKACGADAVSHGCTGKGNDQVLFYQPHLPSLVENVHNKFCDFSV
jgi:argininosuccinate synthase